MTDTLLAPATSAAVARPRPGPGGSRPPLARAVVRGPFFFAGEEKLIVKAVTYGTFSPDARGDRFPPRWVAQRDLAGIRALGANAIRTYTTPPLWLLEEARAAGLRVLVGIDWDGTHCTLDDRASMDAATAAVRDAVERCRRYPEVVLGYLLANEVPSLTVRFHGCRVVQRFLRRLYDVAKAADPDALVSYANYPTTEFLELGFLDFHTLNVYLRDPDKLGAYLDRQLVQAEGKPLLLGELGDDSCHQGEAWQASVLDWSIPLALDRGAAGLCVFGWTDDWVVGPHRVDDWAFGLVDRHRRPKAAFAAVQRRFLEPPRARRAAWPRVSVVVCNYNGGATLDETLRSLQQLDYPDYEVVYVDDGSTDDSLAIARRHAQHLTIIAQQNCGLSVARNVGARAATGSIVAYTDSDAFADPDWLRHLVTTMVAGNYAAVGGPNLTPGSDGLTAQLIALCPGNPTHVLEDNRRADHIAGVNMAFDREVLLGLGGFDPVHRRAGDDVDICWRVQEAGRVIGFSPAAIVWHHRRPSVSRYLKQQLGYGEAENQLERNHPERFNAGGYVRWRGRAYVAPRRQLGFFRPVVYHGRYGHALFQTIYRRELGALADVPAMIQWYLLWLGLLALGLVWSWLLLPALLFAAASGWVALVKGVTTQVPVRLTRAQGVRKVALITLLHFLHPLVRWSGRTLARLRLPAHARAPRSSCREVLAALVAETRFLGRRQKERRTFWGITAQDRIGFLHDARAELKKAGTSASVSAECDNHDLGIGSSLLAEARLYTAPDHWGQALCCGVKVRTSTPARWLLCVLVLAPWLVAMPPLGRLLLAAVPLVFGAWLLATRGGLRRTAWVAVERVATRRGAQRLGADRASQ